MTDLYAVTGNYLDSTKTSRKGARVWLINSNPGNAGEDVCVLAVSRSGRLIEKWDRGHRLGDWRVKALPPAHPLHRDWRIVIASQAEATALATRMQGTSDRWRTERAATQERQVDESSRAWADLHRPPGVR